MVTNATPAQKFVPIKEIRDGVAILQDSSLRAILLSSALNFALKSEENQEAIIFQFQSFVNSLDFSIQLLVQSRRLDIRPYIALLENRYKEQTGELFKLQTREYIEFIKKFTENSNIMTKTFLIVVPFTPAIAQAKKGGIIPRRQSQNNVEEQIDQFEEHRSQLLQRVGVVEQGLTRCGLRIAQLGTEEITELFYKIFNPGDAEKPIKLEQK